MRVGWFVRPWLFLEMKDMGPTGSKNPPTDLGAVRIDVVEAHR